MSLLPTGRLALHGGSHPRRQGHHGGWPQSDPRRPHWHAAGVEGPGRHWEEGRRLLEDGLPRRWETFP